VRHLRDLRWQRQGGAALAGADLEAVWAALLKPAMKAGLYGSGTCADAATACSWSARASRFWRKAPTTALASTPPNSWMVLITPEATPPRCAGRSLVPMLKTGVQMNPMPNPLKTRPGTKSQRPELACATQSM